MKFLEIIEECLRKNKKYDALNVLMDFERRISSADKRNAQRDWIELQEKEDLTGRIIADREIYLKEEIAALEKQGEAAGGLSTEEAKKLEEYERELKHLDGQWWLHRRAIYVNLVSQPKGPMIRRFSMLSEVKPEALREICRIRGGCCAHGCGCCQRPRRTPRGALVTAHCSAYLCGCCVRQRGDEMVPSRNPKYLASIKDKLSGPAIYDRAG